MALIASGIRAGGGPLWQLGANTAGVTERANWTQAGMLRGFGVGEGGMVGADSICDTAGFPNGHTHPSSWSLPTKGGGMSSYKSINGAGDISAANMAMGRALSANLAGAGEISAATIALIVSLSAALEGAGSLSATLKGAVQLAANLAGAGDLTAAIGALVFMSANLSGAGEVSAASTLRGVASMSAEILSYGELTPEGIRDSVWNALAASYNSAGSMGEKVNDAGSASNPWTEVIESGYTAAEILRLLVAHAAGAATGLEGATPRFKSLDGIKTRIDGTYSAGTRGITDLDASA